MLKQPKFEIIVWLKMTEAFTELRDELLGLAVEEPFESTEYQGVVDFHWGFDNLKEAEQVAETLTALCRRPELLLLRLTNWDNLDASVTFKDERKSRH